MITRPHYSVIPVLCKLLCGDGREVFFIRAALRPVAGSESKLGFYHEHEILQPHSVTPTAVPCTAEKNTRFVLESLSKIAFD